ncbi:MAG: carbohydrate-binding family 9-like protein [Treponema sp.]|nr:carbohydrate-binding family 9-like protein [Treponema sp.]
MKTDARIYRIHPFFSDDVLRKQAEVAPVEHFPWGSQAPVDYRPLSFARITYDDASLRVYMETNENDLRMGTGVFGHVHTDSCMEFFLSPDPLSRPDYLNWEFNPSGGMYLSVGTSRHDRRPLPVDNYKEIFQVQTNADPNGWNLRYAIPLSFLRNFFPSVCFTAGTCMRGNFYKCGDNTFRPHYGCWSPIDLPKPDFHCPDFFGTLLFV